jgi:hypothetical protein
VVTANVAAVPTTEVPFDHEYEVPPVAVKEIDAVLHVKTDVLGGLMPAKGGTIVWVIIWTSVSVHPFTLFVAVTV